MKPGMTPGLAGSEELESRLLGDAAAALSLTMLSTAERLGLLRCFGKNVRLTSGEAAASAGIPESCARAMLADMAGAGFFSYDPATRCFALVPAFASLMTRGKESLRPGDACSMVQALAQTLEPLAGTAGHPEVEAQAVVDEETWAAIARFTNARFERLLMGEWIPAAPEMGERLRRGVGVADVACVSGRAALAMARAYPDSRFTGYAASGESLRRAAEALARRRIGNVTFRRLDSPEGIAGRYDVVTLFDVLRDRADPLETLRSVRRALVEDGICLCLDVEAPGRLPDRFGALGAFYQGLFVLHLMTGEDPVGDHSTLRSVRAFRIEDLCEHAGFTRLRVVRREGPMACLYELRP